ncbi:Uncharacterized protein TCM_008191 [Theobroma cacao]|uniref:Uncharacterized protein n=1 Tax=Theobroma cacao TaxID=3641 RepID=A0A061E4F9_THECC|nr:Uncharacterized protein TCM_008191 [Theobroma cacao]
MEETSLGLSFTKDENFREWYSEIYFVAVNSEMIECNDISSYYILRSRAISIGRLTCTFPAAVCTPEIKASFNILLRVNDVQ